MGGTTIHVRGKRKAPPPKGSTDTPKKHVKKQKIETSKSTTKKKTISEVLKARQRTTLDSLPSEVLELIFLYSENFNLPRTSNLLGFKLSAPSTFVRLVIWSFCDTWDQGFGVPLYEEKPQGERRLRLSDVIEKPHPIGWYYQPDEERSQFCAGDAALQTAVLNLPQVSIDVILVAQQRWADCHARGRWYEHARHWCKDSHYRGHCLEGGFGHFDARECFEADFQQALEMPPVGVRKFPWHQQDVHPDTRIPTSLLTGPWDDEKKRRLFWLRRGGAVINEEMYASMPWEYKAESLYNMVLAPPEPDKLIFNCLMDRWLIRHLPSHIVYKYMAEIDQRVIRQVNPEKSARVLRRVWSYLYYDMRLIEVYRKAFHA